MTTIIAKNQTAGDLALTRLVAPDAKIPASGQAQLTDWNAPYETILQQRRRLALTIVSLQESLAAHR